MCMCVCVCVCVWGGGGGGGGSKFPLQPHQKYNMAQYEEPDFS